MATQSIKINPVLPARHWHGTAAIIADVERIMLRAVQLRASQDAARDLLITCEVIDRRDVPPDPSTDDSDQQIATIEAWYRASKHRSERNERGFAAILEMLLVCSVMLILAASALPNIIQIRAGENQVRARDTVQRVSNAQAAITICASTPNCVPLPALQKLVPPAGTVTTGGYTFVMVLNGGSDWTYSATPLSSQTGHATYRASQDGFTCTLGGSPCQ